MSATLPRFRVIHTEDPYGYTIDGLPVPGITKALTRAGAIDDRFYTEAARERGTAAHIAIQYAIEGDLDERTLHPKLRPYLEAWRAFVAETKWEPTEAPELVVGSLVHRFATRIDGIGNMNGRLWVLNWKTGQKQPWWGLQSAGEAIAYSETHGVPLFKISRASVILSADGRHKIEPHEDRNDIAVFQAAVLWGAWRAAHGQTQATDKAEEEA